MALLSLAAPLAAAAPAPPAPEVTTVILQAAGLPIRGLHIVESGDPAGALMWAAWGVEPPSGGHLTTLALLSRDPGGTVLRWSVTREDGYSPAITLVYGWTYEGTPVLALQYQFGAAYAKIEFYGLERDGSPHLLDEREAALISLNTGRGGASVLTLYDAKPTILIAHCAVWDAAAHKLRPSACRF